MTSSVSVKKSGFTFLNIFVPFRSVVQKIRGYDFGDGPDWAIAFPGLGKIAADRDKMVPDHRKIITDHDKMVPNHGKMIDDLHNMTPDHGKTINRR